MEQQRGLVRSCSAELLELVCCRTIGPIKVGRDGVRHNGILYGQFARELFALQGKEVMLRVDPVRADLVTVCDLAGKPICRASNASLRGVGQQEVRAAAQHRARLTNLTREMAATGMDRFATKPELVFRMRYRAAAAAEQAARKALPAPEPPAVTLIRPDLHDAVKHLAPDGVAPAVVERRITWADLGALLPSEDPVSVPEISLADLDARGVFDGPSPADPWEIMKRAWAEERQTG